MLEDQQKSVITVYSLSSLENNTSGYPFLSVVTGIIYQMIKR